MLSGSLSGLLAGLVPGVTSTSATVSASMMCPESGRDEEANAGRFIAMSAAVGTAAMVFGVLALASTGQGGTGALLVVKDMLGGSTVSSMGRLTSAHLALLLLSVLLSSLLAYVLTVRIGAIMARRCSGRSGGRLSRPVLLLVVALCAVMCGPAGLLVLCVGHPCRLPPSCTGREPGLSHRLSPPPPDPGGLWLAPRPRTMAGADGMSAAPYHAAAAFALGGSLLLLDGAMGPIALTSSMLSMLIDIDRLLSPDQAHEHCLHSSYSLCRPAASGRCLGHLPSGPRPLPDIGPGRLPIPPGPGPPPGRTDASSRPFAQQN